MLCHAELEDYFESVAKMIIDEGKRVWDSKKIANYNLASLLIRGEHADKSNLDSGTLLFKVLDLYNSVLTKNHGVKAENIHKMFWPLGYSNDDFDSALLSQLDSFGTLRGSIAHLSAKKAVQQLDQSNVYNIVNIIVLALPDFEDVIKSKFT